jgi:WD40 repeat protein
LEATVRLWDVTDPADPRPIGAPLTGHRGPVDTMVFSPNGALLATSSFDGTVRLWDVADPTKSHPRGDPLEGRTVAFSPDGTVLATDSGENTTVWLWAVD